MKTLLPITPNIAPATPAETSSRQASADGEESFAAVLDRQMPTGKASVEEGDATNDEASPEPDAPVQISDADEQVDSIDPLLAGEAPPLASAPLQPALRADVPNFAWDALTGAAPGGTDGEATGAGFTAPATRESEMPVANAPEVVSPAASPIVLRKDLAIGSANATSRDLPNGLAKSAPKVAPSDAPRIAPNAPASGPAKGSTTSSPKGIPKRAPMESGLGMPMSSLKGAPVGYSESVAVSASKVAPVPAPVELSASLPIDSRASAPMLPTRNLPEGFPVLTAMFPVPMAQLQAQFQVPRENTSALLAARTSMDFQTPVFPVPMPEGFSGATEATPAAPAAAGVVNADPVKISRGENFVPQLELGEVVSAPSFLAALGKSASAEEINEPTAPVLSLPIASEFPSVAVAEVVESPVRVTAVAEGVRPLPGTPAAKGGDVMNATALQAPSKARAAKSADEGAGTLEPVDSAPATGLQAEASAAANVTTPVSVKQIASAPAPVTRRGLAEFDAASAPDVQPSRRRQAEISFPPSLRPAIAVPGEPAVSTQREPAEVPPKVTSEAEVNPVAPANLQGPRPHTEPVAMDSFAEDSEVPRLELTQIVERTLDAALRMRAAGSDRIEISVHLESGDRLTIQLRVANGEVTPFIRTSSDGLRNALEQNWTQFSDRASDRGVRLTPPVFDVNQSGSNMTDLSQQRHGREQAHLHSQAELFPNLPRRMRAPRVIAPLASETSSVAAVGVRTYA